MKISAAVVLLVSILNTTAYANECYKYRAELCKSQRDGLWYMRNGCAAGGAGMAKNDAWRCTNDPEAMRQLNTMDIEADYADCLNRASKSCQ